MLGMGILVSMIVWYAGGATVGICSPDFEGEGEGEYDMSLLGYEVDSLLVVGDDDESLFSVDATFARFIAVSLRNGSMTYNKGQVIPSRFVTDLSCGVS
jgi:hypothetical protein